MAADDLLACGHQRPADGLSLPSIGAGDQICRACHGEAARAVLAGLRPGRALVLTLVGSRFVTWFDETLLVVAMRSTKGVIYATDKDFRVWSGRPWNGHKDRYLMTLTNIDNVKLGWECNERPAEP
jgi:hypothetical protein